MFSPWPPAFQHPPRCALGLSGALLHWQGVLQLPGGPATVWLGIQGLAPQALVRVELHTPVGPPFVLGEAMDTRGTRVPAGAMLLAIARYSGRTGLGFEQVLPAGPSMPGQLILSVDAGNIAALANVQVMLDV